MPEPTPAGPRTLVVLRHGRTEWNDTGQAQGHTDIPLDAVGLVQAEEAARRLARLGPVRLWSSDLRRAAQTAAALTQEIGLAVQTVPALREYDVGDRAGLTLAEFEQKFPQEHAAWMRGDDSVRVGGAESTEQVRARITPALQACLDELAPGETGVVVTHGAALRVGVAGLLGWPPGTEQSLRGMVNCGWLMLREDPVRGLQLVSYNLAVGGDFASGPPSG